jgi:[ribosomal protein S5]-alanine N-acetyltransferase
VIRVWRREKAADALAPLLTRRLRLTAITQDLLDAESSGPVALARALNATVPPDWPPEHWEPPVRRFIGSQGHEHPATVPWHRYIVLRPGQAGCGWRRTLVGCAGAFPRTGGDVEMGYSVVASFQRRGIASEAALTLTDWLLTQEHIRSVSAQTYESMDASVKVMRAAGMSFVGPGDEAATVRYRRTRESRA